VNGFIRERGTILNWCKGFPIYIVYTLLMTGDTLDLNYTCSEM